MRSLLLSFVAAGAALAAQPAVAQRHSTASARGHADHRDNLAGTLSIRLQSIQLQIDTLQDQDAISSEEARNLRLQSRKLQSRLYDLGRREAIEIESGLHRLEKRVRYAADDARSGRHVYGREDDYRNYSVDRARPDRRDDFSHLSRSIAPPVDRWHDAFDRGNNF